MHNVDINGFHWNDGWYFKRIEGGCVQVTRLQPGHEALQFRILPREWASIIASVGPGGETSENYSAALKFHGQGTDFT